MTGPACTSCGRPTIVIDQAPICRWVNCPGHEPNQVALLDDQPPRIVWPHEAEDHDWRLGP